MALAAAQSICLYRDEIIGNAYFRSGLTSHARFHRRRVVNLRGVALMKIRFTSRKSKYFQLIRPYRNFCCFGSEFSTLLSSMTEKMSSSSGTSTTKHETFDFLVDKVRIVLKEWRHLHFMKVVGLLACAFMVIPSANAVDALKTCTCLLKECRMQLTLMQRITLPFSFNTHPNWFKHSEAPNKWYLILFS
ncbi:violaxanthin de-epoxidase, chloroplastic-like isoform X3 [Quercus lobata]|uniref:violaxanthin de-epoxidase, chloroplastic-like isoform X3 n=1 Tax=Quercus lobata TaxID=97700 RepID=UPI0012461455|nr:violaxanthin de-epoxidase, chloroplastic-like isoform X3 [Quercus lobata]